MAFAVAAASFCCTPAPAKDPIANISIDPIVARGLLADVDEGDSRQQAYRLDPGLEPANGQRARLSVDMGPATLFAITGRLKRQPAPAGPLESGDARLLGQQRDSGKVYGGGVSGTFHGIDLSATYQYSKLRSEEGLNDSMAGGPGRSHSLRATARIRFGR